MEMPVSDRKMRVLKYIPSKLYGFLRDDADGFEVFFHLATFQPSSGVEPPRCSSCPGAPRCSLTADPPPPILGELVSVTWPADSPAGKAPRASLVTREVPATAVVGVVESFDTARRYGFVMGSDGVSYHLHESEISDGRLPLTGGHVVFYPGLREGRPRACHVKVCR